MLTFSEEDHTYWLGDQLVPNVTRIIAPLTNYDMVNPEALRIAQEKGKAVHKMVEQWAVGTLDYGELPEWLFPVLEWWLKFVADTGFVLIASERQVYHHVYGFAGTLDLRCLLPKTKLKGQGILDLKRSFMAGAAIGLQTAGYAMADDQGTKNKADRTQWRAALRLREDAPPRLQTYEDPNDFSVFLAALTLHKWKGSHL